MPCSGSPGWAARPSMIFMPGQMPPVQLAPGSVSYVWVEEAPPWQFGYAMGGGSNRRSFFVYNMSPQLARAYFPAMTDLGQR